MPTYIYACPKHGEFEENHSIKEVLEDCPLCKKENPDDVKKVVRLIAGGSTFILSGGGWAAQGYK